jgi:hypothetical protein
MYSYIFVSNMYEWMYVIAVVVVAAVAFADTYTLLFGSVRCGFGDAFHNHVC